MAVSLSHNVLLGITIFSYVAWLAVNGYGNAVGIGGETNASISNRYPTALTPATWAFSVWSLIFTLEGIWIVAVGTATCCDAREKRRQAVPSAAKETKESKDQTLTLTSTLGPLAVPLSLAWWIEDVWTFTFAYEVLWLAAILIVSAFAALAWAFVRISNAARADWAQNGRLDARRAAVVFLSVFPTGVHCGWVLAASSVGCLVASTGYGGSPVDVAGSASDVVYTIPDYQFVLGPIIGIVLTACVIGAAFRFSSAALPGVFAWALTAIADSSGSQAADGFRTVFVTAFACAVVVGLVALVNLATAAFSATAVEKLSCGSWSARHAEYSAVSSSVTSSHASRAASSPSSPASSSRASSMV